MIETRPMLCMSQALTSVEDVDPLTWAGERKWDGWRVIVLITAEGVMHVFGGRNGKEYGGRVTYIERTLRRCLPSDTIVDGEVTSPLGFGHVQSVMSTEAEHVPSDESPALTYRLFDVVRLAGYDLRSWTWERRRGLLEKIRPGAFVGVNPLVEISQATYERIVAEGGEGLVVKYRQSKYTNDQRSRYWRKMKHTLTAEARVVGFKPGTPGSDYEGLVGAIEFELIDTGVRSRCSGFDMDLRRAMTAHPEAYIGRIFELTLFPGVGRDGKPRSPNFLRWRDDRMGSPVMQNAFCESQNAPAKSVDSRPAHRKVVNVNQPARPRNYAAMKPENLRRAVAELEAGAGEAFEKCRARGHDPAGDLRRAREALSKKGT